MLKRGRIEASGGTTGGGRVVVVHAEEERAGEWDPPGVARPWNPPCSDRRVGDRGDEDVALIYSHSDGDSGRRTGTDIRMEGSGSSRPQPAVAKKLGLQERERQKLPAATAIGIGCCGAAGQGRAEGTMLAFHFPSPSSRTSLSLGRCCSLSSSSSRSVLGTVGAGQTRRGRRAAKPVDASRDAGHLVAAAARASMGTREEEYKKSAAALEESAPLRSDTAAPLPPQLDPEMMPRHVAVIMDGNSRWARERGLGTSAGHEAGYRALREIVRLSTSWGVKVLTVFAFSSENWLRPEPEVNFLMRMFEGVIRENLEDLKRHGIRLCIIGDSTKLPKSLQILAKEAAEATMPDAVIEVLVAVSYSGRSDIVQACQKIAQRVKDGELQPAEITEAVIEEELETNCTINSPYPDLLIRTSGELRLSNFLLWQSAYSELYFSKSLWPDFGEAEYIEALSSFQQRQRRFGQRVEGHL